MVTTLPIHPRRDPQTDLAVLEIDAGKLPALTLTDSDKIEAGDVIQEMNKKSIRNAEEAVAATRHVSSKRVLLRVWSQGGSTAVSETKEAIRKKEATLATERADKLKAGLQEVGKKLYAEAAAKAPHARPDVQEPTGEARPGGAGPRGKVGDAEFHETKQP